MIQGRERSIAGMVSLCTREGGGLTYERRDTQTDLLRGTRMAGRVPRHRHLLAS